MKWNGFLFRSMELTCWWQLKIQRKPENNIFIARASVCLYWQWGSLLLGITQVLRIIMNGRKVEIINIESNFIPVYFDFFEVWRIRHQSLVYLIVYDILGLNLASFFRSRLTKLVVNRSYRNYCSNPNTLLSYKSAIDSAISFDVILPK